MKMEALHDSRRITQFPCPNLSERTNEAGSGDFPLISQRFVIFTLHHSVARMLKSAGVSDFVAREIVGHESAAISRQYTHLTTEDKRAAMQRLPDVTDQ